MSIGRRWCLAIALVVGMPDASASSPEGMRTAEAFIDAFYSFEADQLKTLLKSRMKQTACCTTRPGQKPRTMSCRHVSLAGLKMACTASIGWPASGSGLV